MSEDQGDPTPGESPTISQSGVGSSLSFFVPGRPRPKGSTRSFMAQGRMVTKGAGKHTKAWEGAVAYAANEASITPADAVQVEIVCWFGRPKSHFGTGRNDGVLKASAPRHPTARNCGDVDKLARAILDGLTGIAYLDDSAVVAVRCRKKYCDDQDPVEGALVTVKEA